MAGKSGEELPRARSRAQLPAEVAFPLLLPPLVVHLAAAAAAADCPRRL